MMMLFAMVSTFIMGDTKAAVLHAKTELQKTENADKGVVKVALAKALWQDQDQERAFRLFLETVEEELIKVTSSPMGTEESNYYDEALALYLNQRPEEAKAVGKIINQKFGPLTKIHQDWPRLGYVVALAQANVGDYENFFDLFFRCYRQEPKHFLAMKTRGILHIKLMERAKTQGDREWQRKLALDLFAQAEALYPSDLNLYKMEIIYSPPDVKAATVTRILNKILTLTIIPSRVDTVYFVRLALASSSEELASRWLEKAQLWYPDSRTLKQLGENGY